MLYNLDKKTKQKILDQFKQEALNYRQKRKNEQIKRIQEEKEFILERLRKEREADKILKEEKFQRQNKLMNEYHELIKKLGFDKPGYFYKSRNNEVINKNWGKSKYESISLNNSQKIKVINLNHKNNKNLIYNNGKESLNVREMNQSQKEREYIRKEDNMSNYLTDDNNEKEFEKYLIQQKERRQRYYKEILDSLYKESRNKNKDLFWTINPLIIRREKRKIITKNPYVRNSNYDFGQSSLSHNPITNPENNIYYNKYLFRGNNPGKLKKNNNNDCNNFGINNINNKINQFKTLDTQKLNSGFNSSKSSINVFRNNQNKNIKQCFSFDYNNINKNINNAPLEFQNINKFNFNFENGKNYENFHSIPTPSGKALKRESASSIFP